MKKNSRVTGQWRGVWCFLSSAPKQTVGKIIEMLVIWDFHCADYDVTVMGRQNISSSLWVLMVCNDKAVRLTSYPYKNVESYQWSRRRTISRSLHYNDVIMSAMAFQITSLTINYSTVYSTRRSKKTSKLRVTGLCEGNSPVTGWFPSQSASNAENVSIGWGHHERQRAIRNYTRMYRKYVFSVVRL